MFTKGDLHIHSTASDGTFSPQEIIILAKNSGVDIIAITDHNSTDGIDEASEAGRKHGIAVIPAVELSTRYNFESIHILGYFKDNRYNDNSFKQILKLVKIHRVYEARKIFGGFRHKQITENYLSAFEGISLLKSFGAAVVLAHPVRITDRNLSALLDMPFGGIEARYCGYSQCTTDFFIGLARDRFSFYTGGSDFHTDRTNDGTHCFIGEPYLDSAEIQNFLKASGVLVLGSSSINDTLC